MIEIPASAIEVVTIDKGSAVGNVGVVVVNHLPVMPVRSPMVPPPAKSAIEADSKAQAKRNSRTGKEQSWIRIPAWPDHDWRSLPDPTIIFQHIKDLRVGGSD